MSAGIDGLEAGLAALSHDLGIAADKLLNEVIDPIMDREVESAVERIRSGYRSETLADGVRVRKRGPGDMQIVGGVPHAHLVELGTQARFHADGTPTGVMPAHPVMIPEAIATRERIGREVQEEFGQLKLATMEVSS